MSKLPVITVQCDWQDVIRTPKEKGWIAWKYLNEKSINHSWTTKTEDGKIKPLFPDCFQYISHSNYNLVLKHIESELKVAFVASAANCNIHKKALLSVAVNSNALVVSSCEGDKLLVWDSRTNETLLDLKGHGGPIYKCRFFPSGAVVVSTGADGSSKIWCAETGVNPVTLVGHTLSVADVGIVDKGRNVVTVSRDGSAKLWDVGESRCLANVLEGLGPINCCDIGTTSNEVTVEDEREVGTSNKVIVVGCESGDVVCAHAAKREEIFRKNIQAPCNACAVLGHSVIAGSSNGKVTQLNLTDGSVVQEWEESASPVISLAALSNDLFIVGRQDGTCTVVSLQEPYRKTRVYLTGSDCDAIRDISFNGKWVFTACRDGLIRKYDFKQIIVHFK